MNDDEYDRAQLQYLPADRWPRWMGISTAARYLDRTEAAMRGLIARGMIPFVKQGERVYFDREVLDEWMKSWGGRVPTSSTSGRQTKSPQSATARAGGPPKPRGSG